ncbi:MAG: PEGA domain-containing protein, partial [Bacteroidales bacterium]|nr:PEGA domain-containing protein [Candidatus Latescibacterota bacterium]
DGVFRVSGNRYGPVQIKPGHHRITCRQKDFSEYSETINITVGELSKRRILLRQKIGYLSFQTDPGARIFVNGRFIGITPLSKTISLTSGKHMVEMKKAGFRDWTTEVFIPSDETVNLKISLSPL